MKLTFHHLARAGWVAALLLFVSFNTLSAQNRRITGKVSDANEPLPGATIVQKGTSNGVVADVNGQFALNVSGDNPVIVVTFTGYEAQEIEVGSATDVQVTLKDAASVLAETVVTGYTVDTRRATTGAVSTVKSRDLTAIPTANVEQSLQGRVSGITVITNGQPGTSSIVRVRGFGAFGGNEPLYIVDGVPVDNVDFISPDDIESTTVLKDAAAASIYGSRAANGVIVMATKHGSKKAQPLQISYDALVGMTDPGHGQDILNPQEQADWTWAALKNTNLPLSHPQYGTGSTPVLPDYINVGGAAGVSGSIDLAAEKLKYNVDPTAGAVYQVVKTNKSGTNWWDEITRTAPMTRHGLNFSGSTDKSRYYVGLNYQQTDGILIYNSFTRGTVRVNTEFDLGKKWRIGENMQVTYRQVLAQQGGNNGRGISESESNVLDAFRMPPAIPVYDEFGGYAGTAAKGFNNPRNPVAARDGSKNDRGHGMGVFGNVYLEFDPIKNLTLRSSVGSRYNSNSSYFYSRLQYENSENNASFSYGENYGYNYAWVWSNTASYKMTFGASKLDALAGYEALNTGQGRFISASGLNPFSTNPDYVNLSTVSSAGKVVNSGLFKGINLASVFGRLNYGFNDKYYVTAVVRRDGASNFGSNTRYGVFPAFSAAWRVSAEPFMQGVSFIEDLKIRGGWGQMGNQRNVSPDNQYSLYASSIDNAAYDINGTNNSVAEGFYRNRIGNPNAKWETSTTSNIGFDGLLFNGKIDLIVDFWRKETNDLLYQVPLPDVLGNYAASPAVNIASMLNEGVDVQLVNKGRISGNLKYEATITGSWLHNEITDLAPGVTYFDNSPPTNRLGTPPIRNQIGFPISSFYGYQVLGYFKDAADVTSSPEQSGAGPGRFKYADLNGFDGEGKLTGVPDGKIDAADRTYLGSPVPKFTGGVNLRLIFGNLDLSTYIYGTLGSKIFNMSKWYTDFYPSFTGAAVSSRVKNSWTSTNLDAETPIFENVSNFSTNTVANSWYVENGNYLRMQNLTIGYTVPSAVFNGKLSRARVYASANNLFTITKYKGLDPGVGGAADTLFGLDIGNYPVTKSYMFGIGVTF